MCVCIVYIYIYIFRKNENMKNKSEYTPPLPGESRKSKKELTAATDRGAALAAPAVQPSLPSEEEVSWSCREWSRVSWELA